MNEEDNIEIKMGKDAYTKLSNEEKEEMGLIKLNKAENDIIDFLKKLKKETGINYYLVGSLSLTSSIKDEIKLMTQGVIKPTIFLDVNKNYIVIEKTIKLIKEIINASDDFFNKLNRRLK